MFVFKFGGASIKDAESIRRLKKILDSYDDNIVVVVSAMGKMTNELEKLVDIYHSNLTTDSQFNLIKEFHSQIVNDLFPAMDHEIYSNIENIFGNLKAQTSKSKTGNFDFLYDQIVSVGEILSTTIISEYLNREKAECKLVDVRNCLKTDQKYREANVNWELTESLCKQYFTFKDTSKYITQGFISGASDGSTTTLGREGSDYTAAIFANILSAEEVIFWKNVPGILNADPEWFENTKKLDNISYWEAIQLSYYGAKIIHPKTIKPLENKHIPLYIKSFITPESPGTLINKNSDNDDLIPSFIFKMDQTLISISPRDFSFIMEDKLSEIFGIFADLGIKINLMQTSAINFSVCIDHNKNKIYHLREKLGNKYKIFFNTGLELASIRHYDQETIDRVISNKKIYLEQKTRNMARYVLKRL